MTLERSSKTPTRATRDQSASDAAKRIHSVKDVDPYLKFCLYGRNKLGKTKFACSSNLKTLVIDCNEKGFASVRKQPNVDVYELARWEELDPIYWHLRHGKHDYKVLVIDTVTMLMSIGIKWVLKDDYDRDMSRDPLTPDRRVYLKNGEIMKDAIIKFRNLPMHVFFNAQEKVTAEENEEGETELTVHPELSPAPRSVLLSAVNVIGRIYAREVEVKKGTGTVKRMERRILLGTHPKYVTGNRFDELKAIERLPENGGLQVFLDRIYGGVSA